MAGSVQKRSQEELADLLMRKREGATLEALAVENGVSKDRIKQLLARAHRYESFRANGDGRVIKAGGSFDQIHPFRNLSPRAFKFIHDAGLRTVEDVIESIETSRISEIHGFDSFVSNDLAAWRASMCESIEAVSRPRGQRP